MILGQIISYQCLSLSDTVYSSQICYSGLSRGRQAEHSGKASTPTVLPAQQLFPLLYSPYPFGAEAQSQGTAASNHWQWEPRSPGIKLWVAEQLAEGYLNSPWRETELAPASRGGFNLRVKMKRVQFQSYSSSQFWLSIRIIRWKPKLVLNITKNQTNVWASRQTN